MNWTEQERALAVRLIRIYFGCCGRPGVVWDWRDDRYDAWLHIAREALTQRVRRIGE